MTTTHTIPLVDNGGQAFPRAGSDRDIACEGMSLRDYFAGQALAGLMSRSDRDEFGPQDEAEFAYRFADAMVARSKAGGAS